MCEGVRVKSQKTFFNLYHSLRYYLLMNIGYIHGDVIMISLFSSCRMQYFQNSFVLILEKRKTIDYENEKFELFL